MPEPLARRINPLPDSPYAAAALQRLGEAADRQNASAEIDSILADPEHALFLANGLGDCPFLLDLATGDIRRLGAILATPPEDWVGAAADRLGAAAWETRADAMSGLRRARQGVALSLGLADLAGAAPVEAVTQLLTRFADAALQAALRFCLEDAKKQGKWRGDLARPGFFILAMGKQGAGELNYSSDIDLITLFEPGAAGLPADAEPAVFWVRIVRSLVTLLQERTADGYVFRVDLRLRPDPGATAVAISAPGALGYYESMGQNWERAALIKARPCAGDLEAGEAFLNEIAPFIWRKYLDFAAIADIHSIKRQVHAHRGHAAVQVLGHDIKRGRGGIREVEFFVQTQQLIAGGRDRRLRGRQTRAMLTALAERGWIADEVRAELDRAYAYLRAVEHRLQMVRDEQTHRVPKEPKELERIARLMGHSDAAAFEAELRGVLETVAKRYSELFENAPALSGETGSLVFTGGDDDPDTLETIRRLGFKEPETVTSTVRAWHFGRFAATRSTAARESLTELTPGLLHALARGGSPDAGLRAFDTMLQSLPAGAQFISLLANNSHVLDLLATILGTAPRLAEAFGRKPHIIDALLDPASFRGDFHGREFQAQLAATLSESGSYEDALNRARLFAAEQRFLISARLLTGQIDPTAAGFAFSDLAAAVVEALFARTTLEFERQHGRIPGGRAAVLAFGRLGSREMTANSDLDLIVIYDHDPEAAGSDGRRPLPASQYYIRLTQRLVAALSAPTAEGTAYAVDLRLRPSGRAGPLATHVSAFKHYQMTDAWTWEHMAMARGRPLAGDPDLGPEVSAVIATVVGRERDAKKLAADIADMRQRVEAANPGAQSFDLKLAPGGLMDCEFIAQYLILAGIGRREGEPTAETLRRAVQVGALNPENGDLLVRSALLQGALLHGLRVSESRSVDPQSAPEGLRRLLVTLAERVSGASFNNAAEPGSETSEAGDVDRKFAALQEHLADVQRRTRAVFREILGGSGDDPLPG